MADPGDTIYPTGSEIRGWGTVVVNPSALVTGLDLDDSDYDHDLHTSASFSFAITAESAREECLVDTDLHVELRVPGVDNTTCDVDSVIDYEMIDLVHRDNVGIYGPSPAHTHASWDGTGGVDAHPTAGGVFNVTASGTPTLTLALASGFEQRLSDIPSQCFPVGMDGAPLMYWYRKADLWHAYDGQNGGDPPAPYSVPHEAVYCWLGWSWLKLTITAPADCTLTLTLTGRHYSFSDNHLSDSTRQTEFGWGSGGDQPYTWELAVTEGQEDYYVNLIGPKEDQHPLFDRVVSVALSDFADGAWTITEPTLILKPQASSDCAIKTFEGYEYHKGGFSCHVDSSYEYGAGDEDHGNLQEWTVPFFDYVEGAVSGLDTTTAWSLASMADIVEATADAWTCDIDTTNHELATKDDETPANQLGTYCFDLSYPNCHSPVTPLEQDVDGGTANASIRVGTWTIVAGLVCCIRTDKVVHGRAHGRVSLPSGALTDQGTNVNKLWRRPPESATWEFVQWLDADEHGHFGSHTLPEVYDYSGGTAIRRWTYGTGWTAETVEVLDSGAAYTREYLADSIQDLSCKDPRMTIDPAGIIYGCFVRGGAVRTYMYDAGGDYYALTPVFEGQDPALPGIVVMDDGRIVVTATVDHNMLIAESRDGANSWQVMTTADLGTDLENGGIKQLFGQVYLVGWHADAIWLAMTSEPDYDRDEIADTVTLKKVCDLVVAAGDDPPKSDVEVMDDGRIVVCVTGAAGMEVWECRDLGAAFEYKTAG